MLLVKGGVAGSGPVGFRVFVVVDLFFWIWDGGDEDTDRFIKSQNIRSNCN